MLRFASMADKSALKALWDLCFSEDAAFLNWFFDNRFLPDFCPVWQEDGQIAACLHALPVHIRLRNQILPAAIVAGVSTHPDFRGRGLMGKVMAALLRRLRAEGIPLLLSLIHI